MEFTLDTTLDKYLADPRAKALLDKHVPGASTNPMIGMAKGMSLRMRSATTRNAIKSERRAGISRLCFIQNLLLFSVVAAGNWKWDETVPC